MRSLFLSIVLRLQFIQHLTSNYIGQPKLILILNFLFAAFGLKGGIFCL